MHRFFKKMQLLDRLILKFTIILNKFVRVYMNLIMFMLKVILYALIVVRLTRFNGLVFLEKMKGKTIMFVGDSLGRNQWESLICLTWSSVPRVATQVMRGYPLSTFKFLVNNFNRVRSITNN